LATTSQTDILNVVMEKINIDGCGTPLLMRSLMRLLLQFVRICGYTTS